MKSTKRILSTLLSLLMLTATVTAALAQNSTAYQVGDHIQFGTYPQTRVDETPELKAAAETAVWKSYGYYTGTGFHDDGNMTPSDYMQFADFICNGEKYRAVKFNNYRPYYTSFQSSASFTYQDENGYMPNNVCYFEYEPLMWRILDPSSGYILCESIIDAQAYQNTTFYDGKGHTWQDMTLSTYANNYAASSIRTWLNNAFYETAFTDDQKSKIRTTTLNNSAFSSDYALFDSAETNDKIFLPSWSDISNSSYGFSSSYSTYDATRTAQGTDYAQCQGLEVCRMEPEYSYNGYSDWLLRSPGITSDSACYISIAGFADSHNVVYETSSGIRPACKLSNLTSGTHAHTYISNITRPSTCVETGVITYTCTCGDSYARNIPVDPNAHAAPNENGDCPRCGKHIKDVEKPADGVNDSPTNEKPAEKLNFFQRIIQWFRNLFAKLFGNR